MMTAGQSRSRFLSKALLRNNGIARRLILALVLFSSVITAVATVVELYMDYRWDVGVIHEGFDSIRKVFLPSLTESVWVVEDEQIETQLKGFLNLPDIELAEIRVDGRTKWSAGSHVSTRHLEYFIPLLYPYRGRMLNIGELHVVARVDHVFDRIRGKFFVILVSNSIKTCLVAIFMLVIFQGLVGQHLEFIAAYLRRIPQGIAETGDLRLNRHANGLWRPDALDYVVSAINSMRRDLLLSVSKLTDSNRHLEAMIQYSPFAKYTTDRDNVVTIWSPGAEALFGWSATEIVGHPIAEVLRGNEGFFQQIRSKIENGSLDLLEAQIKRRDGRLVDVAVNVAELGRTVGISNGYLIIAADITKWKATEAQLRQAQKMEAVGQLTGGIAHDFNNILGIIMLNLGSLPLLLNGSDKANELVSDCLTAAVSGANLTHRLLAFARQQTLAPTHVAINDMVADMVALMRRTLGENIVVHLELAADPWPVFIDPGQLETSLLNLATNARDAMPDGGHLWIATGNTHIDADSAVGGLVEGDYATVVVSDDGLGMTEEVRTRVFEPFYTTKRPGRGTGLGLSMVLGFLLQSHGSITVHSEPDKGSTFRLYLPRSTMQPTEEAPTAQSTPQASANGEMILVVEDNELLRASVIRQLAALNYHVRGAADAASALVTLEAARVDLVLTDIVMPGTMDGIALARAILDRWPGTKIALTSGFADARLDCRGLASSIPVLNKPYHRDRLARVIRDTLDS
jgi:PAS domain S-box-containing protein